MFAGHETPAAGVNPEDFRSLVAVLGVYATGWLARGPDIEAVRLAYVHMLVRVLGDARSDDGEILLRLAAGRAGVDERGAAGNQFPVTHQSRPHLFSRDIVSQPASRLFDLEGGQYTSRCPRALARGLRTAREQSANPMTDARIAEEIVDYILRITREIWEDRNPELVMRYYGPEARIHMLGGIMRGAGEVTENTRAMQAAFPRPAGNRRGCGLQSARRTAHGCPRTASAAR